jgi:hypothetical protein
MFHLLPINGHSMNKGSAEINFHLMKRRKENKKVVPSEVAAGFPCDVTRAAMKISATWDMTLYRQQILKGSDDAV